MFFIVKRNSRLTLSFKNVKKNKNMEQINCDKLHYDITRFMMSTKTSNTSSRSQRTSPGTKLNIFREIFLDLSGFSDLSERVPQEL